MNVKLAHNSVPVTVCQLLHAVAVSAVADNNTHDSESIHKQKIIYNNTR